MPVKKNAQTNTARRKAVSRTSSSRNAKKRKSPHTMPTWVRNTLAVCIVLVFAAIFYWFFVRPYAYRWKPCYGMKGYGVCLPCSYEVHGIDISHYQGNIDWESLAQNKESEFPLHFVFMKATEGGDHGDERFAQNFELARKYGFVRGAYHYFIPQTDADKQADFFIRTVQLDAGDLPPVLDVEVTGRKSVPELQAAVRVWLDKVEAHYGVKPILYTSYKFKERYLSDSIFNTYPYWIAHYYVDSVRYEGKWHFWQHTDVGRVSGIKEEVDLDVFNGTLEELLGMTLRLP
ncbi:MAG: glycoside hydrolase family 25 protein [Bacteroides sp.]|nr:glycoside hydrolase family 25 protein [Bacteroides sp.]